MIGVAACKPMIAGQGVGVHRRFDAHLLVDDRLEHLSRHVGDRLSIDDPIGTFVDVEDDGLQPHGASTPLDHARLLEALPGRASAVSEPGAGVGLVHLDLSVEKLDRALLVVGDRLSDGEEESMHSVVRKAHTSSDRMVGEFELEPEEQLVDLGRRKPGPSQAASREQAELLPTPFALPAAVGKLPQLPGEPTFDAPCPGTEPDSTEDPLRSRVAHIGRENSSHKALTLGSYLAKCQMPYLKLPRS